MAEHDFSALYAQYPTIIEKMKDKFTSHDFILELACQNQTLYVEALYSYRNHLHRETPAPFLIVHGILAQRLNCYPDLIEQTDKDVPSKDIFDHESSCSKWRKVR